MKAQLVKYESKDWFQAMLDDISALIVETRFTVEETIIRAKHTVGELIVQNEDKVKASELVRVVAERLNVSVRSIEQSVQFYRFDPDLKILNEGKNISWRKVLKKMQLPKPEKVCGHENTRTLIICADCGDKI